MEIYNNEYSFEESLSFFDEMSAQLNDGIPFQTSDIRNKEDLQPNRVLPLNFTVMIIRLTNKQITDVKTSEYVFHAVMTQIVKIVRSSKTLRHLDVQAGGGLMAMFETPMKKDVEDIINMSGQVRSINDVALKRMRIDTGAQIVTAGIDFGGATCYCDDTPLDDMYFTGKSVLLAKLLSEIRENSVNISEDIYINLPEDMKEKLFVNQETKENLKYYFAPLINLRMRKWVVEQTADVNTDLQLQLFSQIDLNDPFFDSLKESYPEFEQWFKKKAALGEAAYVFHNHEGKVQDFLYLKIETDAVTDVVPVLEAKRRLKVGTFKLLSRGTRRGERFMKKIMDRAMAENVDEVYVTIFPTEELQNLIKLFEGLGFYHVADKPHSLGTKEMKEWVLVKDMRAVEGNIIKNYPRMRTFGTQKWLLSIMPRFHTHLFPDSILNNESYDMVKDITPTNGIYKIFISWNPECAQMKMGDLVVIYRMSDGQGAAYYRSVVTSVCTVSDVKKWGEFQGNEEEFLKYTKYSVFSETDLKMWFRTRPNMVVIKMLYNVAFSKRVIRKDLIEQVGLDANVRWGLLALTHAQFKEIIELGKADERYFID